MSCTAQDVWVHREDCGETHEWRSSQGDVIRFVTRWDFVTARMMPPVTVTSIRVPQAQGGRFRRARHEERFLPLPVVAPGTQSGRDEVRRWAKALDPLKGEGTLTVVVGPWAGRQLICVYDGGLDALIESHPKRGEVIIGFRACEPYWLDSTESTSISTLGMSTNTWFTFAGSWAQHPLILGGSDVFSVKKNRAKSG